MDSNSLGADMKTLAGKFNSRDLIIFVLPILIFSIYLFAYNPGILTVDSFSLLHQIATGKFSASQPVLYTFIVIFALKISANPVLVSIFQMIVFSAVWMVICKHHRNDVKNTSTEFFLQFLATLIICAIPINAAYSITLSSHVLFSYAILFLSFLIGIMVERNGEIGIKTIIAMALTIAFISGLSPYGTYIAVILLAVIAGYLYLKNKTKDKIKILTAASIAAIILIASIGMICSSGDAENLKTGNIIDDEINLENAKEEYFSKINETPNESFEDVSAVNLKNSKYDTMDSIVSFTRENVLTDTLLNNPITYLLFSIVAIGFVCYITKSKQLPLILAPNIVILIFALATSQISLYANLLVFYMLAIIVMGMRFRNDLIPPQKTIEKAPQAVEDEAIYDDFETALEELTLEDINEMLEDTQGSEIPQEINPEEPSTEGGSDLVDEILKEIESNRK